MASEKENTKDVVEAKDESDGSVGTQVAQDSQVKSESQNEAEQQQARDRKVYGTPSSESLPRVDVSYDGAGKPAVTAGDKTAERQDRPGDGPGDRSGESREGKGGKPGELGPKLAASERMLFPVDANGRDYHGEGLSRNVTPGTHEVQKGETLKQIAKNHLGQDASEDDVNKYMTEIEKINHLDTGKVQEGQMLNLPGHTNGGADFIVKDYDGNTKTVKPDGSFELQMKDGSKYARDYQKDGSYIEHHVDKGATVGRSFVHGTDPPAEKGGYLEMHGGPKMEDNFTLEKTADGKYKIKDATAEKVVDKYDENDPDFRVERARLRDLAEKNITDPQELKQFQEDMAKLEARSQKLEEDYVKQGLKPEEAHKKAQEEMARTFHEVSRLMEAESFGKTSLKPPMGTLIAQRLMFHLADPTNIDQGLHPTCQTTVVESRVFSKDPAKAAKLIADVMIDGKYTTPDGMTTVEVDPRMLELGPAFFQAEDPSLGYPPDDGKRSYISHIFQVTAVNVELSRTGLRGAGGKDYPPGTVRYEQFEPDFSKNPPDNGERLIDYSDPAHPKIITEKNEKGKDVPIMHPNLDDDQITDMSNALSNRSDKSVNLVSAENFSGPGKEVTKIESEEQLNKALQEAKDKGQLPIVVRVDANNQPFWADSGRGKAGGSGAAHVITVTDYHPGPPPKVDIDNQWGKQADHTGKDALSVHDLFVGMKGPGGTMRDKVHATNDQGQPVPGIIDVLQADVDSGKADTATKIELIRQKMIHDEAHRKDSKSDYPPFFKNQKEADDALANTYVEAMKDWSQKQNKNDGSYNEAEMKKARDDFAATLNELPAHRRQAILNKMTADMNKFHKENPELKRQPMPK